MSTLQQFQFNSQNVRTVLIDGEVRFVGRDVASALGYVHPINAMKRHCRGVLFQHPISDRLGRSQNVRIISQADVLRLIVKSDLPEADKFERWVFEEVLPSVLGTGSYSVAPAPSSAVDLSDPYAVQLQLAEAVIAQSKRAVAAEAQLAIAAPKAAAMDAMVAKGKVYSVRRAANLLEDEGLPVGRDRLFQWLRDHGWVGQSDRSPLQRAITAGYLKHKYYSDDAYEPSTLVTAKGLARIHQLMVQELEEDRRAGFRELAPVKAPRAAPKATNRTRRSLPAA